MAQVARQTAIPCTLKELSEGSFIQNPGLEPSGVKTGRGMISRCSVLGVIIDKGENTVTVEDGTTSISVRSFDRPILPNVGELVLVIGRPREYNGERYLALEICKRVRNPAWVSYRRKELERAGDVQTAHVAPPRQETPAIAPAVPPKNPFEAIIESIRSLDKGNGADIEDVIASVPDGQKFITTLIEEGEVFEIRPGRLKVLE